jgi:thiamine-monophosphate kinase
VSDIAAMAGTPLWSVVSLGVPGSASVKDLDELYRGMDSVAKTFGVKLVGGDTNRSGKWTVSVALIGEAEKGKAVPRSGGRAGDWIFVSGRLGGSYDSKKHLLFTPRVKEARWLAKNFRLHAMMDLSDGLASDIHRIAEESGAGAVIQEAALPLSAHARSRRAALCDGEDFELLFTLSPEEGRRLARKRLPPGFPAFTHVGFVMPRRDGVRLLRTNKKFVRLPQSGFDHFR